MAQYIMTIEAKGVDMEMIHTDPDMLITVARQWLLGYQIRKFTSHEQVPDVSKYWSEILVLSKHLRISHILKIDEVTITIDQA